MRRIYYAMAIMILAAAAPSASAQRAGEMTLYSELGFKGQSYSLNGPRNYIQLAWAVRSIQVAPGESWEVCTQSEYRGTCVTVDRSEANIRRSVASGRPRAAAVAPLPAPITPGGAGRSLRGMRAEFFPAPESGGRRVPSCTSGAAACAAESAERFCKSIGWNRAVYQQQQTVSGRLYLADVLCTR